MNYYLIIIVNLHLLITSCNTVSEDDKIISHLSSNNYEHITSYYATPKYFMFNEYQLLNFQLLKELKLQVDRSSEEAIKFKENILANADQIFDLPVLAVTSKTNPAFSGSYNDYISFGIYWWPEKDSTGQIQYTRRDGEVNPEYVEYNLDELNLFRKASLTLSVSYFLTNNDKYVEVLNDLLFTWFVDPDTKMNPHLNYAQHIPGISQGRPSGIVEGINFIYVLDAIQLVKNSNAWDSQLESKLTLWYSEYLNWLLSSDNGIKAGNTNNNHASWYHVQVLSYIKSLDYSIDQYIVDKIEALINDQINENGIQRYEKNRSLSLHYSTYNLKALLTVCKILNSKDFETCNLQNENSKIIKAVDFLEPFIVGDEGWEYSQIKTYDKCEFLNILTDAYLLTEDMNYINSAENLYNQGCSKWHELDKVLFN